MCVKYIKGMSYAAYCTLLYAYAVNVIFIFHLQIKKFYALCYLYHLISQAITISILYWSKQNLREFQFLMYMFLCILFLCILFLCILFLLYLLYLFYLQLQNAHVYMLRLKIYQIQIQKTKAKIFYMNRPPQLNSIHTTNNNPTAYSYTYTSSSRRGQKSSDIKYTNYIKRTTNSKQKRESSQVKTFKEFKKKIKNDQYNYSANGQLKATTNEHEQPTKLKYLKDKANRQRSHLNLQRNQKGQSEAYKENRQNNNSSCKYKYNQYVNDHELSDRQSESISKIMKFGEASHGNSSKNNLQGELGVYLSSRSAHVHSASSNIRKQPQIQQTQNKKQNKNRTKNKNQNQNSEIPQRSYLNKLYALILSFEQKDKFNTSNFDKNRKPQSQSQEVGRIMQIEIENQYEKVKTFIQKKEHIFTQICSIVSELNTMNNSSPYTFSQQNLIKILNQLKQDISQLSEVKRKNEQFNKALLSKAKQCQNLKHQKSKINEQMNKLNKQIQSLQFKNDKILSQEMAKSQKMSELQYNLLILRKDLEQNRKYERCNRQTLDLQQQLKMLGHHNNEFQREIKQLNQQINSLNQQKSELTTKFNLISKEAQQKQRQKQKQETSTKSTNLTKVQNKIDQETQINQMSQSQRTNIQLKVKIEEQFQQLCVQKLNLQMKIGRLQNKLKKQQKLRKQKNNRTKYKLQTLREKLEDLQCQNNSIRVDISRFFYQAFQIIVQKLETAFLQNYCDVQQNNCNFNLHQDVNSKNNDNNNCYYETAQFTDEAVECKIVQNEQQKYSRIEIQQKDKNFNLIQQLEQKDKKIQELQMQIIQLTKKQQQNQQKLDDLFLNNQKIFNQNELIKIQIQQLEQANILQAAAYQESKVENSKNISQNQKYIQSLMEQVSQERQKYREIQNEFKIKQSSQLDQIRTIKEDIKKMSQNDSKKRRIMRISSFILDYKIQNNLNNLHKEGKEVKFSKLFILSQVFKFVYPPSQLKNSKIGQNNQNCETQTTYYSNMKDADSQTNNDQDFTIIKVSKRRQSLSKFKCQQICVFSNWKVQSELHQKELDKQHFSPKILNFQRISINSINPTKIDTFATYFQKFNKISSQQIQQYLANASIQVKNYNFNNLQSIGDQKQIKITSINKGMFQSGQKKQKNKYNVLMNQEENKAVSKSVQKNLKLVGSLYHDFDFRKGQKELTQKDESQFDLCI